MIGSVAPGANRPRLDLPRIKVGQKVIDPSGKEYLIAGERWVRDGTFHAGHSEFYCMRMNPSPDTLHHRMERWVKEKTIQETCIIDNVVSLR